MAEETILIVDDDRTIVRFCQLLLERSSYQAVAATNPLDAIKILEQQKIDLLLSDIRMPIMDGFELISRARQYQPDISVLVMTGYGSIENAIQALHRGVDGLILKPFENSAELLQAVQRILGESSQKRDAARLQALRPLFDVTEQLLAEISPPALEKHILNAVTSSFQADFAAIYRFNPQVGFLELVRKTEMPLPDETQTLQQQVVEIAMADDTPSVICASGPGCYQAEQNLIREIGWETLLVAPVRRNENRFVFCACRKHGSAIFNEADLEMFVILARQAAVAMENARLYHDLKQYVRQVEESQRALVQAEKMAAVGRLVASLSHEINNPLQAVRNCLHLATRKGVDNDQHYHYLKMADDELERLVATVRYMLDFYRPSGVEQQKVNISQVIDQVLALLGPQFQQLGMSVSVQYVGESAPLLVVPDQIQQVILNLLINAMDAVEAPASSVEEPASSVEEPSSSMEEPASFMEDGASSIGEPGSSMPGRIWIDVFYERQQVRVLVEDSGPGIPEGLRERIFEPFVSSKVHGTGLGLAVSYGIIERHRGRLSSISPRHGKGACFEVVLPFMVEGENGKDTNR